MRFSSHKKSRSIGSAFDLTPVVDVVFNLLLFFAVTLNFAASSGGINVKLPTAGSAAPLKAERLTVNITKGGDLYLNDKPVTLSELEGSLEGTEDKDTIVIIRADDQVNHGRVVAIMDSVRTAGFSRLAIAAEQVPRRPKPSR